MCGARCRQAPEVLSGGHATAASDCFAFGVVLWVRLAGPLRVAVGAAPLLAPPILTRSVLNNHPASCARRTLQELATLQLPWLWVASPFEVWKAVTSGERLPIPPREELPGLGSASPESLDEYWGLVRCAHGGRWQGRAAW